MPLQPVGFSCAAVSRSTMCCPAWRSLPQPFTAFLGKPLGIVWVQANSPAVLAPGQAPLKGEEKSPPRSRGSGSAPGPLLRPSPGSAPVEADEIIPRHNRAHCQEDFNDIQPTFSASSDHPIIPTYGSLSPFSRDPILTPFPKPGLPWLGWRKRDLAVTFAIQRLLLRPPWCHHSGEKNTSLCFYFWLQRPQSWAYGRAGGKWKGLLVQFQDIKQYEFLNNIWSSKNILSSFPTDIRLHSYIKTCSKIIGRSFLWLRTQHLWFRIAL